MSDTKNVLTPDQQEILYLRLIEKYSLVEIAQLRNVSVRNIDKRLYRIRRRMNHMVESQ